MSIFLSNRVAQAFAPLEKLCPSQWAEKYRILTNSSAEPGPFRFTRTPYIRGIIDSITEKGVREIAIMKSVQVGYSTLLQNLIGWTVDQEPGPTLLILPNKEATKALMQEQIQPLIESSPQIQSRLRGDQYDVTADTVNFDSMSLFMGSMGSPITLQGRAIRYVYIDEPDRGPASSAEAGNPVDLARSRLTTFGDQAKLIIGCTPSTPGNHIATAYEAADDRRTYHVPCPHCGCYQRLVFSGIFWGHEDVKTIEDHVEQAAYIEQNQCASYRCQQCEQLISHDAKTKMLARGLWVSEGQRVRDDGTIDGARPQASRIAFHVSALYSPWVSWSEIAGRFLRSQHSRTALQVFHNETLAEPFRETIGGATVEAVREVAQDAPADVVPGWASVLVASADTQGSDEATGYFYYVVRAWGRDRSQLVTFGRVKTTAELRAATIDRAFTIAGTAEKLAPVVLFVDSKGHRTTAIYDFAATDQRIKPVVGVRTGKKLIQWGSPAAANKKVLVATVSTTEFKDELHGDRIAGRWLLNNSVTDEFLKHIASEAKVRQKNGEYFWETKSVGAANHFLDCEVYNYAGASFLNTNSLPNEAQVVAQREASCRSREQLLNPVAAPVISRPQQQTPWLGGRSGKSWF